MAGRQVAAQIGSLIDGDFVAAYCGMSTKKNTHRDKSAMQRIADPTNTPLSEHTLPSLARNSYVWTQRPVVPRDFRDQINGFDESHLPWFIGR